MNWNHYIKKNWRKSRNSSNYSKVAKNPLWNYNDQANRRCPCAPHLTLLRLMMSTHVLERELHADANDIAVIFHFCGNQVKKYRPIYGLHCLLCEKQQQQQLQTHVWVFCVGIRSDQIKLVLSDAYHHWQHVFLLVTAHLLTSHSLTHSFIASFIQFALYLQTKCNEQLVQHKKEGEQHECSRRSLLGVWEAGVVGIVRMCHWWEIPLLGPGKYDKQCMERIPTLPMLWLMFFGTN